MKKLQLFIMFLLLCGFTSAQRPIITKWDTGVGKFITITTVGDYSFTYTKADNPEITGTGNGVTGSQDFTFPESGAYILEITPVSDFKFITRNILSTDDYLVDLMQWGDVTWNSDLIDMFAGYTKLKISALDVPDFSNVNRMYRMFNNCSSLTLIPYINSWDTSNVTNFHSMFSYATNFNDDISGWNTSKATDMSYMFQRASNFNQDLHTWDTGNVIYMGSMFASTAQFNANISTWNTSYVKQMWNMFKNSVFNQDIGSWNTSNVTTMDSMFENSLFNQNIGIWDLSKLESTDAMFSGSVFNQNIGTWNTGNIKYMGSMFAKTSQFNQDISTWDTSNVETMYGMFSDSLFNQDIGNWDTSNVTQMSYMFAGSAFNRDIGNWNTSKGILMRNMFQNASAFNQDLSSWDTGNITDFRLMFSGATSFNQNLGNWPLNMNLKAMDNMLDNSGIDCINYGRTLMGWSKKVTTTEKTLGAAGLIYGSEGKKYRDVLINNLWRIYGDIYDPSCIDPLSTQNVGLNNKITAYPIPTTGILYIHSDENGKAELYKMNGQFLRKLNLQKGENKIDISNFQKGVYLIKYGANTTKVIKS